MTLHRRLFLASTLLLPAIAGAKPGPTPAPLTLALDAPERLDPTGYLVSEKYDGVRAWWDGQQLRFRSGRALAAPAWFVATLPPRALDGELWLGRGRFQALVAAVRRSNPVDEEWRRIRYMAFDLPGEAGPFAERASRLSALVLATGFAPLMAVAQESVSNHQVLQQRLQMVLDAGGEGLMLHRADAPHRVGRSASLLKLKPAQDAEATVVGHQAGRGKHQGRLGALLVRNDQGIQFLLGTGMSDAVREAPPPVGSRVTYTYRGHTDSGVPRFASYWRQREL
jgi:DNA ligase-1